MTDSACTILNDLRTLYRDAPILTLAQTALWDDPIKALVKGMLDATGNDVRLVLGIMDTDYFSRLPKPPGGTAPFAVLPHNDGSTRDLWAAVGEMSSLLGAETPLPLHTLASYGVHKGEVAATLGGDCDTADCVRFIDRITEAWGWRGIAQTQGRRLLAGEVPLRELAKPLAEQIDWALSETAVVADRRLGPYAEALKAQVADYVQANPEKSLADLYLAILPGMYGTLLGYAPEGLHYTRSSELLQFNRYTANRVRFRPLDLFLQPETVEMACRHYNAAVHDGGIATLDRFGPDAIPFELAIPGHGRGTLHISETGIQVDTDDPIYIPLDAPIRSRRALAITLENALGPGIALLGKAVVLITMLAGEYIFLFNETGSPYVPRSCRWNELLTREGFGLRLYPILRLGVSPWDTVGAAGGQIALPPHMASTFGTATIAAEDFQREYQGAIHEGERDLRTIREMSKSGDWLDYLAREEKDSESRWKALAEEHRRLRSERREHGRRIREINVEGERLIGQLKSLRQAMNGLEIEKGRHFRSCIQPLRDRLWKRSHGGDEDVAWVEAALREEMDRRAGIEREVETLSAEIAGVQAQRAALAERRRALSDAPVVDEREQRLDVIQGEAECEKARRVRNAWMTVEALRHSQPRPSAWWFPTVDPSGAWFRAVSETAEFHWQSLTDGSCAEPAHAPVSPEAVLTI